MSTAAAVMQEAADLGAARRQWLENGRMLQRAIEIRQRAGLPLTQELRAQWKEWDNQGKYLEHAREQLQDDTTGLGIIPLLIIGGGAIAAGIAGIFTARKAIQVQEQKAEREAEIVRLVTEGEITPEQATAMTTGAGGEPSIFKKLFGISPLILIGGALAVVFGKDLLKKVMH